MEGEERRAAGVTGTWGRPPCATVGIDFTADRMDAQTAAAAVGICLECPVMVRCLAYLRDVEVAGIAGGMTRAEREDWREAQGLERSPASAPVWATTPVQELEPADIEGLQVRVPRKTSSIPRNWQATGDLVLLLLRMHDAGWKPRRIATFLDRDELPVHIVTHLKTKHVRGSSDHTEPSPGVMPWDLKPIDELTPEDMVGFQPFAERTTSPRPSAEGRPFTTDFVELARRMTDEGWSAQQIADFFPGAPATAESIDYLRREVFRGSRITEMRKRQRQRMWAQAPSPSLGHRTESAA